MKREFSIPGLDGLRACAFLLVFLAHARWDKIIPGGLGVTIFFFLSGYLITSLLRIEVAEYGYISLRRFYLRRVFRIFPPMYVTLALVIMLSFFGLVPGHTNTLGITSAAGYFYNYAGLITPNVHLPAGAGVIWSLMIEEHFYFVFPILFWFFIRRQVALRTQANILIGFCCAALIWRYVLVFYLHTPLETLPRWTYSATDARFDSILWGVVLALRDNPWFNDQSVFEKAKGWIAFAGLMTLIGTLLYREPHYRETLRYTLQSLSLYPIFYYCVGSSQKWQVRWLQWKPLRWIGWLSYSLYLIHLTIVETLEYRFPGHPWANILAAFLIALGFAVLMRSLVEQPARRLRDIIQKNRVAFRETRRRNDGQYTATGFAPAVEK